MSTTDSVNVALAFILASYAEQPAPIETTVVRNAKSAASKATKSPIVTKSTNSTDGSSNVKSTEPGPKSEALPSKGTIDAHTFLKGLSLCGKRPNANGVMAYQGDAVKRDDEMRLIASFVGWDNRQLHGAQLENARRTAQLSLKPVTAAAFKRGVPNNTLAGFIAGLPDHQQKLCQDLLAREQVAAAAIVEHEMTIQSAPIGSTKRALAEGLMKLEEERLSHIRKDLATLGTV